MRFMTRTTLPFTFALCLAVLAVLGGAQTVAAQAAPELPAPSPKARVEQRVGLTDFAVDYSSPGVKGRVVFGGLLPYDKPWRTGANAATTLKASRDFTFGDKKVTAGTYAIYMIPGKAAWTVALSSQLEAWGNDAFDATKDVARITVKPTPIKSRERLTFLFSATTDDSVRLELEWEKVRIAIPLAVDTKAQAQANIDKAVDDAWRPQFTAARYLLDSGGDLSKALSLVDASIAVKSTWWNNWVRAQVLAKKGQLPDATVAAEKAQQLGQGDRVFEGFYKADIAKSVASWKSGKK
jgi:hypothetical protein